MPDVVAAPPVRVGAVFWAATGLCAIVLAWAVLSLVSFVVGLFAQSTLLGGLAAAIALGAASMVAYAVALELRAYRSLAVVEKLRIALADPAAPVATLRAQSKRWLRRVRAELPDAAAIERLLDATTKPAELRRPGRRRRRRPRSAGHPADCRPVRPAPGRAVTLTLVRRAATTAAATTGITLVSQGLAEEALSSIPGVKHVSGALGAGTVAIRLYCLATITAQACSPI